MRLASANKADFAKWPLRYANGARVLRTGALALAAALVAALAGAFGTGGMELLSRALFWIGLIGWNWLKWELLFVLLLPRGLGWRSIVVLGCLLAALTIPFEVSLAAGLAGATNLAGTGAILLRVIGLNLLLGLSLLVVVPWLRRAVGRQPESAHPDALLRFPGTAIPIERIAAMIAQDHYVELHLADGSRRLVHHRFRDALAAVAPVPGAQVHRGAWIADHHRGEAERQGARWAIRVGEQLVPVSRNRVGALRALGWLGRRGS